MLSQSDIRLAQARFMLIDQYLRPEVVMAYAQSQAATLDGDCAAFFDFENFRETYVALLEDITFRYAEFRPETWLCDALCASLIAATGCTYYEAASALGEVVAK